MIVAIIAGGSGTRLWPLSTPEYPKHLLTINGDRSLLQSTYDRAKTLTDNVYVLTESSHSDFVKQQLPELAEKNLIIEPGRKGTASVIMLGLHHIRGHHGADESVIFFHADYHLTDIEGFALTAKTAASAAEDEQGIALVGIEPRYPATGFGYIKKGARASDHRDLPVYRVEEFKEKPNSRTAQEYLASGKYLWNMGLFAAPLGVFEATVAKHNPQLFANYQKLGEADRPEDVYHQFEEQPIDTALIEKADNVLVVPGMFNWSDIGSFLDLYHVVAHDDNGNYQEGNVHLVEAKNDYIHNTSDKPVLVIGLDNIVVVNTDHGLLVTRRDKAQKVGPAIKDYWGSNPPKK